MLQRRAIGVCLSDAVSTIRRPSRGTNGTVLSHVLDTLEKSKLGAEATSTSSNGAGLASRAAEGRTPMMPTTTTSHSLRSGPTASARVSETTSNSTLMNNSILTTQAKLSLPGRMMSTSTAKVPAEVTEEDMIPQAVTTQEPAPSSTSTQDVNIDDIDAVDAASSSSSSTTQTTLTNGYDSADAYRLSSSSSSSRSQPVTGTDSSISQVEAALLTIATSAASRNYLDTVKAFESEFAPPLFRRAGLAEGAYEEACQLSRLSEETPGGYLPVLAADRNLAEHIQSVAIESTPLAMQVAVAYCAVGHPGIGVTIALRHIADNCVVIDVPAEQAERYLADHPELRAAMEGPEGGADNGGGAVDDVEARLQQELENVERVRQLMLNERQQQTLATFVRCVKELEGQTEVGIAVATAIFQDMVSRNICFSPEFYRQHLASIVHSDAVLAMLIIHYATQVSAPPKLTRNDFVSLLGVLYAQERYADVVTVYQLAKSYGFYLTDRTDDFGLTLRPTPYPLDDGRIPCYQYPLHGPPRSALPDVVDRNVAHEYDTWATSPGTSLNITTLMRSWLGSAAAQVGDISVALEAARIGPNGKVLNSIFSSVSPMIPQQTARTGAFTYSRGLTTQAFNDVLMATLNAVRTLRAAAAGEDITPLESGGRLYPMHASASTVLATSPQGRSMVAEMKQTHPNVSVLDLKGDHTRVYSYLICGNFAPTVFPEGDPRFTLGGVDRLVDNALAILEEAIALGRQNTRTYNLTMLTLVEAGHNEAALAVFRRLLECPADSLTMWGYLTVPDFLTAEIVARAMMETGPLGCDQAARLYFLTVANGALPSMKLSRAVYKYLNDLAERYKTALSAAVGGDISPVAFAAAASEVQRKLPPLAPYAHQAKRLVGLVMAEDKRGFAMAERPRTIDPNTTVTIDTNATGDAAMSTSTAMSSSSPLSASTSTLDTVAQWNFTSAGAGPVLVPRELLPVTWDLQASDRDLHALYEAETGIAASFEPALLLSPLVTSTRHFAPPLPAHAARAMEEMRPGFVPRVEHKYFTYSRPNFERDRDEDVTNLIRAGKSEHESFESWNIEKPSKESRRGIVERVFAREYATSTSSAAARRDVSRTSSSVGSIPASTLGAASSSSSSSSRLSLSLSRLSSSSSNISSSSRLPAFSSYAPSSTSTSTSSSISSTSSSISHSLLESSTSTSTSFLPFQSSTSSSSSSSSSSLSSATSVSPSTTSSFLIPSSILHQPVRAFARAASRPPSSRTQPSKPSSSSSSSRKQQDPDSSSSSATSSSASSSSFLSTFQSVLQSSPSSFQPSSFPSRGLELRPGVRRGPSTRGSHDKPTYEQDIEAFHRAEFGEDYRNPNVKPAKVVFTPPPDNSIKSRGAREAGVNATPAGTAVRQQRRDEPARANEQRSSPTTSTSTSSASETVPSESAESGTGNSSGSEDGIDLLVLRRAEVVKPQLLLCGTRFALPSEYAIARSYPVPMDSLMPLHLMLNSQFSKLMSLMVRFPVHKDMPDQVAERIDDFLASLYGVIYAYLSRAVPSVDVKSLPMPVSKLERPDYLGRLSYELREDGTPNSLLLDCAIHGVSRAVAATLPHISHRKLSHFERARLLTAFVNVNRYVTRQLFFAEIVRAARYADATATVAFSAATADVYSALGDDDRWVLKCLITDATHGNSEASTLADIFRRLTAPMRAQPSVADITRPTSLPFSIPPTHALDEPDASSSSASLADPLLAAYPSEPYTGPPVSPAACELPFEFAITLALAFLNRRDLTNFWIVLSPLLMQRVRRLDNSNVTAPVYSLLRYPYDDYITVLASQAGHHGIFTYPPAFLMASLAATAARDDYESLAKILSKSVRGSPFRTREGKFDMDVMKAVTDAAIPLNLPHGGTQINGRRIMQTFINIRLRSINIPFTEALVVTLGAIRNTLCGSPRDTIPTIHARAPKFLRLFTEIARGSVRNSPDSSISAHPTDAFFSLLNVRDAAVVVEEWYSAVPHLVAALYASGNAAAGEVVIEAMMNLAERKQGADLVLASCLFHAINAYSPLTEATATATATASATAGMTNAFDSEKEAYARLSTLAARIAEVPGADTCIDLHLSLMRAFATGTAPQLAMMAHTPPPSLHTEEIAIAANVDTPTLVEHLQPSIRKMVEADAEMHASLRAAKSHLDSFADRVSERELRHLAREQRLDKKALKQKVQGLFFVPSVVFGNIVTPPSFLDRPFYRPHELSGMYGHVQIKSRPPGPLLAPASQLDNVLNCYRRFRKAWVARIVEIPEDHSAIKSDTLVHDAIFQAKRLVDAGNEIFPTVSSPLAIHEDPNKVAIDFDAEPHFNIIAALGNHSGGPASAENVRLHSLLAALEFAKDAALAGFMNPATVSAAKALEEMLVSDVVEQNLYCLSDEAVALFQSVVANGWTIQHFKGKRVENPDPTMRGQWSERSQEEEDAAALRRYDQDKDFAAVANS